MASHIKLLQDGFEPIENRAWPVITCELPNHLKFPVDAGASLVLTEHPEEAIPAQILAYDSNTGSTKLAVEKRLPGTTGSLVIDFKWLIKRFMQWLEKHGTNVQNPFTISSQPAKLGQFLNVGAMSDEQISSVKNLLENPVAYVWGPPGTGKTRHVLAETVAHLIRQRKRVLVTASTNLAVDNALDAVLRVAGVKRKDVLRIGLPSSEFRDQWPECCESRAFNDEMAQLKQRLKILHIRLNATQRRVELSNQFVRIKEVLSQTDVDIGTAEREIGRLNVECSRIPDELAKLNQECVASREQLFETKQLLDQLALGKSEKEILILEREQTKLMGERQDAESKIAALHWWEKLFTSRIELLSEHRDNFSRRLDSVEATLDVRRNDYKRADQEGRVLKHKITEIVVKLSTREQSCRDKAALLNRLALERTATANRLEEMEKYKHTAQAESVGIQEDLIKIDSMDSLPTDQSQIVALEAEIQRVQNAMAKICQDLSDKLVLGMTLDGFIGLTMDKALRIDHVIVDEAGYAPLAKVLPLCSLHCPISLLGDHCQLPPVYEGMNHVLSECYWGTSAIYLEEAFDPEIGTVPEALCRHSRDSPRFGGTSKSTLTRSYRFDQKLADLLDRHFYEIGLCSCATVTTSIDVIDCPPKSAQQKEKRQNLGECSAIVERVDKWLNWLADDKGKLVVLSPYRHQVKLLQNELRRHFRGHPGYDSFDVLTVHKAQGREWDTVFFSASDTGRMQGNSRMALT